MWFKFTFLPLLTVAFVAFNNKIQSTHAANSVQVSQSCYMLSNSIQATFSIANPQVGDWIGMTNSSTNINGPVNYLEFLYTCGTPTCNGKQSSGTLTFFNKFSSGAYKAVLFSSTNQVLAVSSTFMVSPSCSSPHSLPSRRPSLRPSARPTVTTSYPINITAAKVALQGAAVQISALVQSNPFWLQQFLRLLFHDCHGVCDGKSSLGNIN